jgi:tetratricopeptide (TPR) repeat protein
MFLDLTSEALDDMTTIDQKLARYAAAPTTGDAAKLGRYYDARSEFADALPYYQAAQEMNTDPETDYLMPIFETSYYGHRKDMIGFDALTANAQALFTSERVSDDDLILAARMLLSASREAEMVETAVPYVAKAVERTNGTTDPEIQKARSRILPDYDLLVLKDPEKAVADKKASLAEGWREDPDGLNAFAWWCFENRLNLEEAQALAQKGVDLSQPGAGRAMILDTLAEICNARDDCDQAVALMRQAIQDDPDKEYYREQLKRFTDLLAEHKGGKR